MQMRFGSHKAGIKQRAFPNVINIHERRNSLFLLASFFLSPPFPRCPFPSNERNIVPSCFSALFFYIFFLPVGIELKFQRRQITTDRLCRGNAINTGRTHGCFDVHDTQPSVLLQKCLSGRHEMLRGNRFDRFHCRPLSGIGNKCRPI